MPYLCHSGAKQYRLPEPTMQRRQSIARIVPIEEAILHSVVEQPSIITGGIPHCFGVSYSIIWWIMNDICLHSFSVVDETSDVEICAGCGGFLDIFPQLSDHFSLFHCKLNTHTCNFIEPIRIHVASTKSPCLIMAGCTSQRALLVSRNCGIHSVFYNVMRSFAVIHSYVRFSSIAAFYTSTEFERSIFMDPV